MVQSVHCAQWAGNRLRNESKETCLSDRRKKQHQGGAVRRKRARKGRKQMKSNRIGLKYINNGYWNCSSAKQMGPKLECLLYESDILLSQETQAGVLKYPRYICYTNQMSQTHHGQVVLIIRFSLLCTGCKQMGE